MEDQVFEHGPDRVGASVIGCVAATAKHHPEVIAVEDFSLSLSYDQLVRVAINLAHELETMPPGRVGLVAPCSAASVAAEVGIGASGRAVVPLDPSHPEGLSRRSLVASGAVAVVASPADEATARRLAGGRPVLLWEPDASGVVPQQIPRIEEQTEFAVYFTSGSTGTPKGVVQTQRPWVDAGTAFASTGGSGPGQRILLTSPMAFSAAGYVSAFALCGGATLSVYDISRFGLGDLPDWIRSREVTGLSGVLSGVRAIIDATAGVPLPSVEWVMYGGEAVAAADVRGARRLGSKVDTLIIYISTELGLTTLRRIPADAPIPAEEPIHSGWPCAGRRVAVVDDAGRPVEVGVQGAIEVFGPRMSCYLHEPATNDLAPATFPTADVGRLLRDGGLQVTGRSDQVVKIRGYQVDVAGVELQLREMEEVGDVAVVLGRNGRGGDLIVSYVVPAIAGTSATILRGLLVDRMPAYMIPGRIVMVDVLPRLTTEKVDRVELVRRAQGLVEGSDRVAGRAPTTPTEKAVGDVFAAVLGLSVVGADDDFFALGGSSLDVVELLVQLESALGVALPASVLTHRSTPELLAGYVDAQETERSSVQLIQGSSTVGRPPIHLVYDLHGSPFRMRSLAAALGPDQLVYGFECPLIFGEPGAPRTIEGLAECHVSDLLARQPDGPYHLCGYSIGGLVLFEIAAQLCASGHEVGFLGVIDFGPVFNAGVLPRGDGPKPPGTYPVRAPVTRTGLGRAQFHIEKLQERVGFDRVRYVAQNLRLGREVALAAARWDLERHGRVRPSLRASWSWYGLMDASRGWKIRPVDVDIDLFLCDQTAIGNIPVSRRIDYESRKEPTLGWSSWARQVRVHPVLGYHNALVEQPYVGGVGGAVRRAFDDVVSGAGRPAAAIEG